MKVTFWGAAKTVTGSMHEIACGGQRFLLDCGLYQGRREEAFDRNRHLAVPGRLVADVVLSHAHIDHSGNLPSLAKTGFGGLVYATPATRDLCDAMLKDSAFLQEKDAEFVNKRLAYRAKSKHQRVDALYTIADAERILGAFRQVPYDEERQLNEELSFRYHDAGHLLGSAFVALEHRLNGHRTRLIFSGDVGRAGMPIIRDPEPPGEAEYLILESTYGNRIHQRSEDVAAKLAAIINRTAQRGGRIIVPAFAVGRTQQLVLLLHDLAGRGEIPRIPIFVDSPLAVNATEVYRKHPECFDEETNRFLREGDPFGFGWLKYIRDVSESKSLNSWHGPMVIISASGMAEAGRILHHLRNNIEDPRNTVLIVGFQAEHTLGRKLVERRPEVPVFGEPMRLRAEVAIINELSGHADQQELLAWIKPHAKALKRVFLVHGEVAQSQPLAALIRETYGIDVVIPDRGDSFLLD
jgi:metallo-beta-lactamase family protein